MTSTRSWRNVVAILLALMLVVGAGACGGAGSGEGGGSQEDLKVGALVAGTNVPYLATYARVMREEAKKAGVELIVLDANFEPDRQNQQMDDLISQQPDSIIVNAVDAAAIVPALQRANQQGIPLVASNNGVDESAKDLVEGYTGPDDYHEGGLAAELMADALNEQGKVVMIEGAPGTTPQIKRGAGFKDRLAEVAPDIELLDSQTAEWDRQKARQVASDFITRYGDDLNGIFGQDDTMAVGAADAVSDAGRQDDIQVVGLGGSETGLNAVKEGDLYGTMLQSPVQDAKLAVEAGVKLARGEDIPENKYLKVPKITAENVDEFEPEW